MRYDVLYADPPWAYRNLRTGGSHRSGAAQKYQTMTLDEVAAMPVLRLMSRDAACFLWATAPLGGDPYRVLAAWGFVYKTEWYWHKTGRKGTGYWTRGCVEKVLVGVRGRVAAWRSNLDNLVESRPTGHSRKPEAVRRMIEALTPGASRVELFATERVPGWDGYGLALDAAHDFRDPAFWDAAG